MRHWNLGLNDPLSLGLAADSRMSKPDYTNDHIWEILFGGGAPSAISLQTTYGLRARNMRIFPQFTENHQSLSDPSLFESVPIINKFYSNYIKLKFAVFIGIEVELEYWIPDSQTVAGRIHILNSGENERKIGFELISLLNPTGYEAQAMLPKQIEAVNVLQGRTANLSPVIFITGGAKGIGSPHPALLHDLVLIPNSFRQFTWVQAALPSFEESFKHSRKIATLKWSSEIAKIEMENTKQLEVHTGNSEWDAVFAMGQKTANSLLFDGNQKLQETSFVNNRLPDQGYSILEDGSDYNHLWNGQTALDAWYLSQYLLPGSPKTVEGILKNFINSQNEDGQIDWKLGLAGQRSQMQAFPILTTLTWQLYQYQENKDFLIFSYPYLIKYVMAWFNIKHDRNRNGIPEWDNHIQTGYDDNPLFSQFQKWAQAVDIHLVESPDLCAYLYKECKNLLKIAEEIQTDEHTSILENFLNTLKIAVEKSWDARAVSYRYWDRESQKCLKGKKLAQRKGPGEIHLDLEFDQPARLQLRFEVGSDVALKTEVSIHGKLANGQHRVEKIDRKNIRWMPGLGSITIKSLYSELDFLQITGLPKKAKVSVYTVDLKKQDQSLLMPIWAGIPEPERVRKIIDKKLNNNKAYHHPFGIPASITQIKSVEANPIKSVWLPFNVMLAEGLINYQAKEEAQELFERLMDGITRNLKTEYSFRKLIHAEKGFGMGERNPLAGLPPLGLFQRLLGVQIHSPWKVTLTGFNPFPWPVTLKFQGLIVESNKDSTKVSFPDGQTVNIEDPAPCIVEIIK